MKIDLIGATGFVGSAILKEGWIEAMRSRSSSDIFEPCERKKNRPLR